MNHPFRIGSQVSPLGCKHFRLIVRVARYLAERNQTHTYLISVTPGIGRIRLLHGKIVADKHRRFFLIAMAEIARCQQEQLASEKQHLLVPA